MGCRRAPLSCVRALAQIDSQDSFLKEGPDVLHCLQGEDAALAKILRDDLGQGHLFEGWEEAGALEKKRHLLQQLRAMDISITGGLRGYLERARTLLAASAQGLNPLDGWVPAVPKGNILEPHSKRFAELERVGLPEVGGCCFVLVAGGLGERLGYSGIKLELPTELITGSCFLELYCRQILALQARYGNGRELPLAIMVSDDTKAGTERLLRENGNFGMAPGQVTLLKQEKVPALIDNDARMALEEGDPYTVQAKPHGHGDVHALLHSSGLAAKWLGQGGRWVFLFQDTNSLALHALPSLLGTSLTLGLQVNSCSIPRKAKEAIGAICRLSHAASGNCITANVEYNQIDPLLRASGFAEGDVNSPETGFSIFPGNINQLLFALPQYAAVLERTGGVMAEFVNPKYKDAEKRAFKKPTRLECMMQDYPKALEGADADAVGFTSLPQWLCFSPVKNSLAEARAAPVPACAASGEADKYRVFARTLQLLGADVTDAEPASRAGVTVSLGPAIVFDPSFALAQSEIAAKFPEPKKLSISSRSTLVIKGPEVTVESLSLDGALTLEACEGAKVIVKELSVSNAGCEFVGLAEGEALETLAMRGYGLQQKDMSSFQITEPGEYILSNSGLSKA